MTFCLEVTYNGIMDWPSPKRFDERLEAHLGKQNDGSGYGCSGRDMTWSYRSEEKAKAAAKAARAFIRKEKKAVYRAAKVKVFKY